MSELFGKKSVMAAALVAVAAMNAGPAMAGGNCESYAKLTLQQAKQNIDKRCNFKGAAWSLDANKHRAWCKDVGPVRWRAELQKRNKMLKGCGR